MRMSVRFGKTLREKPAEAELASHELMLRGGFIAKLAAGIYNYMPMAWRSVRKIQDIMRREMDAVGGQEINMPVVHPADIWQESGRWYDVGPEMVRFKDRSGRDMVLAMTHEEPVTDLARRYVDSYKQLPLVLYHIQTKFRDEPRSRGGLIRVREFIMKDAYSFHRDQADLDAYYPDMCRAYRRICRSCGVPVVQVLSDVGMMGGSAAHEFTFVTDVGEDTLILCPKCGYAANREVARVDKAVQNTTLAEPGEPELVETPGCSTIASVAQYLGVPAQNTMKTMVYATKSGPVVVVIRGDLDVNDRKLANAVREEDVRLAEPSELQSLGWVQGFMSPWKLGAVRVVADDSLKTGEGFVAGANKEGWHVRNVVPGRDFSVSFWADVASAREGDPCPSCGSPLEVKRGIEVGNTFKLGTKYSGSMRLNYQDEEGREHPVVMGCYGMGVGRLLACVIEANHDDKGIVWPISVAPYQIYLVVLGNSEDVRSRADTLYSRLTSQGFEVLYDDRDESAGVKFNDADLLGMPIRITVSSRSIKQGGVEVKLRRSTESIIVKQEDVEAKVRELVEIERLRLEAGDDSV